MWTWAICVSTTGAVTHVSAAVGIPVATSISIPEAWTRDTTPGASHASSITSTATTTCSIKPLLHFVVHMSQQVYNSDRVDNK